MIKTLDQRMASDLRAISRSFKTFDGDIESIERLAREQMEKAARHEASDAQRFSDLTDGQATLEHEIAFLVLRMDLIHDQLIEGFRKLGAQMTKRDPDESTPRTRRGANGR